MNRTQHLSNNDVLGAPRGTPIEECSALPITRVRFADGMQGIASFWQPSAAEVALISAGKSVRLLVLGTTHAPIAIGVDGDGEML